jgi:hypothetical protein
MDSLNSVTVNSESNIGDALVEREGEAVVESNSAILGADGMARLFRSTDAVAKPATARAKNNLSQSVQKMWERSDEMNFKARGDRDMTQEEVTEYLDEQSNPFEPLPDDHEERILDAIEKGDLEALQQLENVHVYQTFRDQKKDKMGDDYDENALEKDQVAMCAKEIWRHFDGLRKLRTKIVDDGEWDQLISEPSWAKFIRWYPTFAGAAADLTIHEHEVDSLRQMLEQKHMLETDANYTRDRADAAFDMYSHGAYAMACKKSQDTYAK